MKAVYGLILVLTCLTAATGAGPAALPPGWTAGEIGNGGALRGSSSEAGGVWTLTSKDDRRHVVVQRRSGSFTLTARVLKGDGGFYIGNSLAERDAAIVVQSGTRQGGGAAPAYWGSNGKGAWGPSSTIQKKYDYPVWLRVERYQNCTRMSASADGEHWDAFQTWDNEYGGAAAPLDDPVLAGLFSPKGTVTFDHVSIASGLSLPYSTTWIGNSWGGSYWFGSFGYGWSGHGSLYTRPNGECLLNFAGDALDFGIVDAEGKLRYKMQPKPAAGPITSDDRHIYYDTDEGLIRGNYVPSEPPDSAKDGLYKGKNITGLCAFDGKVYVSLLEENTVKIVDAARMTEAGSIPVRRPHSLARDAQGNLWIAQYPDAQTPARVLHFTTSGKKLPEEIHFTQVPRAVYPGGIAVSPADGKVYVPDHGQSSCVWIFQPDGRPAGRFGDLFGLMSGRRGEHCPTKLWYPRSVGFDAKGNLYVLQGYQWPFHNDAYGGPHDSQGCKSGCMLSRYSPDGTRTWSVYGAEWDNNAQALPGDETSYYTTYNHYRMDYSRPAGQDVSLVGMTCDPETYPDDPRAAGGTILHGAFCRNIDGKPFIFMPQWARWGWAIFRPDPKSETLIPCGWINMKQFWIDASGNGQKEAAEVNAFNPGAVQHWDVDQNGGIWTQDENSSGTISYYPCKGLVAEGLVPSYDRVPAKTWPSPPFFNRCDYVQYDAANDCLYLGGYTARRPRPNDEPGSVGSTLQKYSGWLRGERRLEWTNEELPFYIPKRDGANGAGIGAMDHAGDYLFLCAFRCDQVVVLRKSDGQVVETLYPGAENAGAGEWLDSNNGISAYRRTNGEYVISVLRAAANRDVVIRWQPKRALAEVAPDPEHGAPVGITIESAVPAARQEPLPPLLAPAGPRRTASD